MKESWQCCVNFPPLNYLFYPAVPEKYIVPVDNPWEVTAEALVVMQELATEAGDEKLGKMLRRYEKKSGYIKYQKDSRNALQEQSFTGDYSAGRKKSGKQHRSIRTEIFGRKTE